MKSMFELMVLVFLVQRRETSSSFCLSARELSSVQAQGLLLVLVAVIVVIILLFLFLFLLCCVSHKLLEVSRLRIPQKFDGDFELRHLVAEEFLGKDANLSPPLYCLRGQPGETRG